MKLFYTLRGVIKNTTCGCKAKKLIRFLVAPGLIPFGSARVLEYIRWWAIPRHRRALAISLLALTKRRKLERSKAQEFKRDDNATYTFQPTT